MGTDWGEVCYQLYALNSTEMNRDGQHHKGIRQGARGHDSQTDRTPDTPVHPPTPPLRTEDPSTTPFTLCYPVR